ncbi:DNA polymerase I [Helcococcus bovis]|uniref:DNA polymerase I n=1 Tax=Helcococcus bovis TaxID=3153252 RepID=UPI0038B7EE64
MEKILLIDGSSLIFRAFYAIRNLSTREGIPTGAVYGFINMYNAAIEKINPDYVLVAFDKSGPTFRTLEYSEYKGNRQKTPDELLTQFGIVKDLLDSYNIKHIAMDEYEADDIIGTVSKLSNKKNIQSYMLTGDRDYFQLVDEMSNVLYTKKGISLLEIYDVEKVKEKYELSPEKLVEVKGLMGDASDNIPGIPGVGEKTAIKLVKEYGNLEAIYENLDKISGKVLSQKLVENREMAFLSRKLGKIFTSVPLNFDIENLRVKEPNRDELYEKYKLLEFNTLTTQFAPKGNERFNFDYKIIGINRIGDVYAHVLKNRKLIFEFIVDGDYLFGNAKYIGIKDDKNKILVVDLEKDKDLFVSKFKEIFENQEIQKIGFDLKKQYVQLNKLGIELSDNYIDLMLVSYLINPKGDYSIKDIAFSELEADIKSLDEYLGSGKFRKTINDLEIIYVEEYLANNLFIVEKTVNKLIEKLENLEMEHLLYDIELPLVKVLGDMEIFGVKVERKEIDKLDIEISTRIEDITKKIFDLADGEFNLNSPKQLGEVLFDKLKLPVIKKTKTGYSTNVDVLHKLRNEHEIIPLIEEYRQLSKLKSTYIDGLIPVIKEDGRIHSKFNQTVAVTGRLSSTEPNLQNIPIKTEEGRMIRMAFVAGENKKLVSADYSQIELRVLASLSKDETMIDAFKHNIDIHTKTASEVFGVAIDEVTKLQRSNAKAVNFGIVYGISDYSLSQDLDIPRKEAKSYIDGYLRTYPNIAKYMDKIIEQAKEQGYVDTLFHRRRYIPELKSSNFNVRSFGERIALNTPIQGTAADIIKIAMVNVYNRIKSEKLKSKLILQIHDELIIETSNDEIDIIENILKEEMEKAVKLEVALLVDVEVGNSWYEV